MADELVDRNKDIGLLSKINSGEVKELENDSNVSKGMTNLSGNIGSKSAAEKDVSGDTLKISMNGSIGRDLSIGGDLNIGDHDYSLKINVPTSGAEAGDVRIRADGGTNRLMLGGGNEDTLIIKDGKVGIGTSTPNGKLDVKGSIHAGNSEIYFTNINHHHYGFGNQEGFAAIENDSLNQKALMILGRSIYKDGKPDKRVVRLWDYLQVKGNLDITGNVGIGTTGPDRPLAIHSTGGGQELVSFLDSSGKTKWHINMGYSGLNFAESGVADGRFFIKAGGNIGIGTINPQYTLDVKASRIKLGLEDNGGGQLIITNGKDDNSVYLEAFNSTGDGSASNFVLSGYTALNVPNLHVNADNTLFNGNVGIGKADPSEKLEVNGKVKAEGFMGNGTGITGLTTNQLSDYLKQEIVVLEFNKNDGDGATRTAKIGFVPKMVFICGGTGAMFTVGNGRYEGHGMPFFGFCKITSPNTFKAVCLSPFYGMNLRDNPSSSQVITCVNGYGVSNKQKIFDAGYVDCTDMNNIKQVSISGEIGFSEEGEIKVTLSKEIRGPVGEFELGDVNIGFVLYCVG